MDSDQLGQLSISNLDIKWVVNTKEFHSKQKGESIVSPSFFVNDIIQNVYLQLNPKGDINSTYGNMSLYLWNKNDYDITLNHSFSLLNNDDQKVNIYKSKIKIFKANEGWGWSNYVLESFVFNPANNLIKDDKITIVCTIYTEIVIPDVKKNQILVKINQELFSNKTLSDVTVKSNGQEFQLHKCILAAHSSVFKAMFETDMVEKEKNIVEINDFRFEVLEKFFKYMYFYKVDDLDKIAKDLLIVADKYLVTDLKDECEETMCRNITFENVVEYLKVADFHNAKKLKNRGIKFILNKKKFKNSANLDTLSKKQLLDIINCYLKQ